MWKKFDSNDNEIGEVVEERQIQKYPQATERFIFEAWMPPEFFGTEEWWDSQFTQLIEGQFIKTLGPFPRQGDYELLKVLETPRGHFVPLTATICDALIHTARLNRTVSTRARLDAKREMDAIRQKDLENKRRAIIDDLAGPEWNTQPHIICPDMSQTVVADTSKEIIL